LELAKKNKVKDVAVHVFLDGRDTLYNSALDFVGELSQQLKEFTLSLLVRFLI
jgi:bisphosphoglycerate-independent phosphoglycerate mutase (AlkP superfamily)